MNKDFDGWNMVKKRLDRAYYHFEFSEGEIWWGSVGVNIGNEQNGKGKNFCRPVLVYKKINKNLFYGIPFTHTPQHKTFWTEIVKINKKLPIPNLTKLRGCR